MGEPPDPARRAAPLESLKEALPYIVYIYDLRAGEITYINRDLERELGYAEATFDRRGWMSEGILHEEDRARLPELFARWQGAADDDVIETEYRLRDAQGRWRWILGRDTVRERDAEGRVVSILGTALDITERKNLEARLQVSQKLEALGRLAGGIAHDFNNILTVVLGNAELARAALDDREWVADCLDQIRNAAEQASTLTRSLLAFARQQVLRPEVIEVNALLGQIQRLLRRLLGEDIELLLELDEDAGALGIDRSQLTQIVLNLAVNARDAMPEGGRLTIRTGVAAVGEGGEPGLPELAPARRYLVLSVDDTGVGMDADTLAQIFEPFFSTKPEQRGSGLGLATVYGIVRQCEGTISVRSEPGKGTTFSVYLPRIDEPPASASASAPRVGARRSAAVLLVEDAAPVAAVIREVLERAGYRVALARDGHQAIEWIEAGHPLDLLVVDLILPGCSGLDVARVAAGREAPPRVLVISGHARDINDEELRALGAEFMAKPFTPEAILERVDLLLD